MSNDTSNPHTQGPAKSSEEMKQLGDLMVKMLQSSGPSPFFWAVSKAIELSPVDDLNKPIIVYNRHKYAARFFDNRADQLKHNSLNKKNDNDVQRANTTTDSDSGLS